MLGRPTAARLGLRLEATRTPRAALGPALLAVFTLAIAGGCRHTPESAQEKSGPLFPLDAGMTWTFRLTSSDGESMDTITRVESVVSGEAHMSSGTSTYTYEIRDDGIYRPGSGAYLLKEPATKGRSWDGPDGGTVSIVAVDETVSVPAGTFAGCVRVEEVIPTHDQSQIYTFCPGVGPVCLDQFISGEMVIKGELIGFGPTTDLELERNP